MTFALAGFWAVFLFALLKRAGQKTGGERTTYVLASVVVGVILLFSLDRVRSDLRDPWDTPYGTEMRAGFMAGCDWSMGQLVSCECVFDRLSADPPYDTPEGFATLAAPVRAAQQAGTPVSVPSAFLDAARACRRTTA